jgi:hypothetical protein
VFAGCHRGEVAPRCIGLGPPQHSSSSPGKFEKEGRNFARVLNDFLPAYLLFSCLLPAASILGQRKHYRLAG